ncbi:fructuronate reductase [Lachnotalea glycerini]|uniref:Fructuronate reductase n=1 Tax=Lachnotalea glycerini TaxID=1763509 RepID=A0A318ESS2_9FIRM|nr:mannitol dehydrogenase family protein [Lachnotalea glycerini]PXV91070.1 fructuronate reductase [Lachnotalea glycerini]
MKLLQSDLSNKAEWEALGYELPQFDSALVKKATKENPFWIHFGSGNIFRAFQANVVQTLLNKNILDRGLIVAEGYDYEIIEKINHPHDDLSILVTLKSDGSVSKTVVGSVVESLTVNSHNRKDFDRLKEIFKANSLQMVSFTITEKGYSLVDGLGKELPNVTQDMLNGPADPESYIGKVASLLYTRFQNGKKPIAMVSMDNCSHNGDKLYDAMIAFGKSWEENGLVEKGFCEYLNDSSNVSFPCTMIDKITPRPDSFVCDLLNKDGLVGLAPLVTTKNTYIAPFVNAEECEYLVIEDSFPNGRPALEKGGFIFTTRETVDKVERMKVCTCLNPLHTALAIFGCLLGYDLISKEMQNPILKKLVELIGYQEGLPVVVNPGIINPKEFIDTVVNVRIPNPFMPDTPQRIATDTSQKLAIRFGETIKAYVASSDLNVLDLKYIPLVFAGWLRYLMAIDDKGNSFELSPDPLLDRVCPYVNTIKLGDHVDAYSSLKPLLQDKTIFGIDLCEVGLAKLVCDYFAEMIIGEGAIEAALNKYVTI